LRPLDCCGVHRYLVCTGAHHGAAVFERSNTAASGEKNRQLRGDAADSFEKSGAAVAGSRNVEHHQFVSALGIIASRERNGVARIAQTHKVHALHDAFAVSIEARDDAVREAHAASLRKYWRMRAPESPLFLG